MAHKTGKGVRVAIIDSGVHAAHPHVQGVAGGVAFAEDGREHTDFVDRLGHGTAVAAAIREKAPDAELYAVKIFDHTLSTGIGNLVQAIDWAAGQRMPLINLSLGTPRLDHESVLGAAVERAAAQGSILISAREDAGTRWLPGCLSGVIPVLLDWKCPREQFRITTDEAAGTAFAASGFPRNIPGVSPERNLNGISFAVANMTGFAARALEAHPGICLEELISFLCQDLAASRA